MGKLRLRFSSYLLSFIQSIREGLIAIIPVLFIGSFALVFQTLPVPGYLSFASSFGNGIIYKFFNTIQTCTLGLLSVYFTISITICFSHNLHKSNEHVPVGCILSTISCFCITVGFFSPDFKISYLGGSGMFSALLAAITGTLFYHFLEKKLPQFKNLYSDGANLVFNKALRTILPVSIILITFSLVSLLITSVSGCYSIQTAFVALINKVFQFHEDLEFINGFFFILVSSVLWLFGIHGSNVMEPTAQKFFAQITPDHIVSKSFIDVFILMGGCGTMICLIISALIFSKRKNTRRLARLSIVPSVFNISEVMLFGLPVVYNKYLFIPFITVPLLMFITSFSAIKLGIVPPVTKDIIWTTPVFLSGYAATGSIKGSILQAINLCLGTLIYVPFIKLYDKHSLDKLQTSMNDLVAILKKHELSTEPVVLTQLTSREGTLAKSLVTDLEYYLNNQKIELKYQPQYDNKGECIGAEGLLRWNHPSYGYLYPPLAVKIAKESDLLWQMEKKIFEKGCRDYKSFKLLYGEGFKLSLNITVDTLYKKQFLPFLEEMVQKYDLKPGNICIEITEEEKLQADEETTAIFKTIKQLGFLLALDDFSMGHTSLKYLQSNQFDFVKLDGALTRAIMTNDSSKEIISSIVYLSKSLDFKVLAEFVESDEQQKCLETIGCLLYQGYLYSPAVTLDELKAKTLRK